MEGYKSTEVMNMMQMLTNQESILISKVSASRAHGDRDRDRDRDRASRREFLGCEMSSVPFVNAIVGPMRPFDAVVSAIWGSSQPVRDIFGFLTPVVIHQ
jgi:hypothetical protein